MLRYTALCSVVQHYAILTWTHIYEEFGLQREGGSKAVRILTVVRKREGRSP